MLVGISKLGLVRLAMLPTDLRSRRVCRIRWWRSRLPGTRIGVREGEVAEAIFTSRRHPLGIAQADRSGGSTEPNSI